MTAAAIPFFTTITRKIVGLLAVVGMILLTACGSETSPLATTQPQPFSGETPMSNPSPAVEDSIVQTNKTADRAADKATVTPSAPEAPVPTETAETAATPPGATLFNFAGREPSWMTVDDNVMGGVSQSTVNANVEEALLTFSGRVSLENNGGFASARSQPDLYDLTSFDGVVLRIRGDGKAYRFRVYTEPTGRDVAYTAIFKTVANSWTEVYIPFAEMVPLYRGFVVNQAGPLKPESIRSFGLMIADKQEGEFKLEVEWIKAVKPGQSDV